MRIGRWLGIGCLLGLVPLAWAHAVLLESSPAAGAAVTGPTVAIELRFNSRIDGKRSRLSVACPGVAETVLGLDEQRAPEKISGSANHVKPGSCTVRWQVLATDGHITRGTFMFQVK